jgi:acetylornithine/LysW-gamma-L-lysine aminotransferase
MNLMEKEEMYSTGVYKKRPVVIVRGAGAKLWDIEGKEYIDCAAGIGVASIGHSNQQVSQAIFEQSKTLLNCPEMFYNDRRSELLEKLSGICPEGLDKTFLCNSGTEAVEAALKFSRLHTGKDKVIATMRGFHGRTMGSLCATWKKEYREPFSSLLTGVCHVPYGNAEKIAEAVDDSTAAVVLEALQGEGGVRVPPQGYLQEVRKICDENDLVMIVDEVQSGFGRTGRMWAFEHYGVVPDVITVAKAIAGGVPMGAMITKEELCEKAYPGVHGSTFGGNPLSCAAAIATIDFILENDLPGRAAILGERFLSGLREFEGKSSVREVRGMGLMLALELKKKVNDYLKELMDRGIIALPAGKTVLRFLPPLVIEESDIDTVLANLDEIL